MQLIDVIRGRWATRAYTPAPLHRYVVEVLIESAVRAPSAMNEQPWCFCVVDRADRLAHISAKAIEHMLSKTKRDELTSHHRTGLDDPRFNIFYHAPALVVVLAKAGPWAVENGALAAENLMLAAYDQGLGSCWVGLAQPWLATDEGQKEIRAPAGYTTVAPIILGYPAGRASQAPRRAPDIRWVD